MSADESGENVLQDTEEELFRLVHPSFVHDGRVSSQALRPTPKDQNLLSVDRGSLTTPEASFKRFEQSGFEAAGVVAVTVGECDDLSLPVRSDPLDETESEPPNEAHALIDFTGLPSAKAREKAGKKLAQRARARGWLFQAGQT